MASEDRELGPWAGISPAAQQKILHLAAFRYGSPAHLRNGEDAHLFKRPETGEFYEFVHNPAHYPFEYHAQAVCSIKQVCKDLRMRMGLLEAYHAPAEVLEMAYPYGILGVRNWKDVEGEVHHEIVRMSPSFEDP